MNRIQTIVAAVFALLATLASAQAPDGRPKLTLPQVLEATKSHYPRVKAARQQQQAAEASIGVALAAYLPQANILWQTNRATANNIYGLLMPQSVVPAISGPVLPADNGRSAWSSAGGALLAWQPFDFGARAAQVSAARNSASAADAHSTLTELDVAALATSTFFDLAAAEQISAAAQANVDRLQVFAKAVHVLADNQLRPGADAAQADAQVAVAGTEAVQARTDVVVRRARLSEFTGIANIEIAYGELLERPPVREVKTMEVKNHPAAKQEAAVVKQQEARLQYLRRSYVPQFNALASVSGRGAGTALNGTFPGGSNGLAPDTLNWAAGIQVTFPAFEWFTLHAQKKVQSANLKAEEANYGQVVEDLSAAAQQADAQLAGARSIAQNTPVELDAARQSEMQQRARFQAGLATVIEVSAAESLLLRAEADDALARLNTWRALAGAAFSRGDVNGFVAQLPQGQP